MKQTVTRRTVTRWGHSALTRYTWTDSDRLSGTHILELFANFYSNCISVAVFLYREPVWTLSYLHPFSNHWCCFTKWLNILSVSHHLSIRDDLQRPGLQCSPKQALKTDTFDLFALVQKQDFLSHTELQPWEIRSSQRNCCVLLVLLNRWNNENHHCFISLGHECLFFSFSYFI